MAFKVTPMDEDVLVVIDVQNDFCPGGALAVPAGDAVVPIVNRLARRFAHVVLTQDWHTRGHTSFASAHPGKKPFDAIELAYGTQVLWPDHCVQNTPGAAFHAGLDVPRAELIVRKGFHPTIDSYSAFSRTTAAPRPGCAGTCASAASATSMSAASRPTIACATPRRTRAATASRRR